MEDPLGAARALLAARFPDALAGFLGGSTARGEGTTTSDLDVVVVLDPPAGCHAESLTWGSWPVELFVHTPESARAFMGWDRDRGSGTMAFMCARGVVLLDRDGTAARLRDTAERILAAGPPAATDAARDHRRYCVTDLRDDLLGARDEEELLAVAAALLEGAAELLLATRGHWRGGGKWLPRRLREADPELAGLLLGGYRALVRGGPREAFASAVDAVLHACGGPLWAGYRRTPDPRMLAELGLRPG
ncbi:MULTISPECIES: nucleotidyltransferase domain-containing protein [unclassified Streptomyces]|uniref:nucleotidyltransferase domain-containing protein n=1 Tax=unclassified Streptomyces TaxID=2593676 RepID=UPI00037998AD|nr:MULTISPECIES: nucleotidyltransferase domain-containing protein [unclassified Streptomyces]MYX38227.1 nucleotidyltransferase domain-containing protein [Streptomyces sp. SID8377]